MFLSAKVLNINHHLDEIHVIFQNCLIYLRLEQNSKAQKWYKKHPYDLQLKILLCIGHMHRKFYFIIFFSFQILKKSLLLQVVNKALFNLICVIFWLFWLFYQILLSRLYDSMTLTLI